MTGKRQTGASMTLLVIFILVLSVLPAAGFNAEPATIVLEVEPGMTYSAPLILSAGVPDQEGTIILAVLGLGQSPLDGTYTSLDVSADTSPYSARTFISLNESMIQVRSGDRAVINATIAIPADARDGGRYAVIVIRPPGSGQPVKNPDVLVPVFLVIKGGNTSETGEITGLDFSTEESGTGLCIGTTFQNTGNYHLSGVVNNVTVTDSKGTLVARSNTKPLVQVVIPGQEVRFNCSIGNDLPDTAYTLTSRIEKHDGSLIAEQQEPLAGRAVEVPDKDADSLPSGENPKTSVPGFGAFAVLAGMAVALMGRGGRKG